MKFDRLLSALMLLQARGRLSTREMAERLEVSERTAHRDMEALCSAGIPLIAYRGAQGGWELQKGWRTKVPGLDDAELQALLMVQPSGLGDRRLSAAAQRAFNKLMASMPASTRLQAESIRERLHIDPSGWRVSMEDVSMLPVVQESLARSCKLTFSYTRADGAASTRTVDPLGIVNKQTIWYLVAQSAAGIRTFRVSRMREATVLAIAAERPGDFELASYWKRSTASLQEKMQQVQVRLALAQSAAQTIGPWCAMTAAQDSAKWPEGWRVFDVEFENFAQARFFTLGLGSGVKALAPAEFCKEIAEEISRM